MTLFIFSLGLSYLVGSLSPSYGLGKLLKGIDLRDHGSGNVGATNAYRVLGKGPGIVTFFIDFGKGFCVIYPLGSWVASYAILPVDVVVYKVLLGCCVIAGHNWPLFLGFKGGKGVATTAGVFMALAPTALLIGLGVWVVVTFLSRNVGVGSLTGALVTPFSLIFLGFPKEVVIFGFLVAISIFYTHRTNIQKVLLEMKSQQSKK